MPGKILDYTNIFNSDSVLGGICHSNFVFEAKLEGDIRPPQSV